jgi:L-alanine-DL-glutamate epimerase-like enolase superfamily enzyme
MTKSTDIRVLATKLFFLPLQLRMPLKFGAETVTSVTCARVAVTVVDRQGRQAVGWGETPLSVTWVWPSRLGYEERHGALKELCVRLAKSWASFAGCGHPMEVGHDFQEHVLPGLVHEINLDLKKEPLPWLGALVCCSAFDLAVHDAYGACLGRPVYETYGPTFMNRDLAAFIEPAPGVSASFAGRYPEDFLVKSPPSRLPAWHLVGGLDLLESSELTGNEPADGYPVVLRDWLRRDQLKCLKIKLRGNDARWDYERLTRVGTMAVEEQAQWLTADFNCTVAEPDYVNQMLDQLRDEHPRLYGMLLYVEQPFPYDLEKHRLDVHSVSARKPLFLDESAHDWRLVRLGRELGWSGVALKTCKTQTGALLSACWAKVHGMTLMVQDLTNPMLAQIPHVTLAARVGTIMGVETNAMQFYPDASRWEAAIHPGLYQRREGLLDLSTLGPTGFGYRVDEIQRPLPTPVAVFE